MQTLQINLIGKYWKEKNIWIARIEGLDVEVKAPTPYQTLLKLVDTILTDEKSEIFDCSISVVDSGIFYLKLRRINEAHP